MRETSSETAPFPFRLGLLAAAPADFVLGGNGRYDLPPQPDTAHTVRSTTEFPSFEMHSDVIARALVVVVWAVSNGIADDSVSGPTPANQPQPPILGLDAVKVLEEAPEVPDARLEGAVNSAIKNHEAVAHELLSCFLKKSTRSHNRMLCAEVLRQSKFEVPAIERGRLMEELRDSRAEQLIRITAASILLAGDPQPSPSQIQMIKEAMFLLFKQSKFQDVITISVFSRLSGDSEVEEKLLDHLRRESHRVNRDGLLYALGKRKSHALIPIIRKELDSGVPDRLFSKARMYLALGDIGGSEAAQLLVRQLNRETDWGTKDLILWALGATKTAEGRYALLNQLKDQETGLHVATLFGLKFLGDASTIPEIQHYLSSGNVSEYRRRVGEAAIEGISQGNATLSW